MSTPPTGAGWLTSPDGVQLVAEVVDRAMCDQAVDDEDGVVSGAMESLARALRVLARAAGIVGT